MTYYRGIIAITAIILFSLNRIGRGWHGIPLGCNEFGQLGLGQVGDDEALLDDVAFPRKLVLPQKVAVLNGLNLYDIVAADDASCAVTTTGELFL